MPAALKTEFLLNDLAIRDIVQWIENLSAEVNDIKGSRELLIDICKHEAKAFKERKSEQLTASVINACSALGDSGLLLEVVSGCAQSHWRLDGTVSEALARTLHRFSFSDVEPR